MNHGTSQIDNVLAGVQHLCKELGTIPESQAMQNLASGGTEEVHDPTTSNLVSDVRKLVAASEEREDNAVALEASVNGLIAAVHEDLQHNLEARHHALSE